MEALKKKERQDETQFTPKVDGKFNLYPNYFVSKNFHSQLHHVSCPIMLKLAILTP
jgi:hypothetical protein